MDRTHITIPRVHITDILASWSGETVGAAPILLNIRGCNGAGKSTIPMSMLDDPNLFLLTWYYNNKEIPFATVFPSYNCVAMGTYMNKTGGLDTYRTNAMTRQSLELLWNSPYNILMEGVIASTIKSTYSKLFRDFTERKDLLKREIIIASLVPPVEVCLERVQKRNGGKPVKTEQIVSKWNTVNRNVEYFKDEGFTSLRLDNSKITKDETLEWFNSQLLSQIGRRLYENR